MWGAPPDELYGRFTAELTGAALAIEDSLAPTLAEGTLVQRLALGTGAPAVSPDGERIAVVLRRVDLPSRLVVWATRDSVDSAAVLRARERARRLDPEDVPAVRVRPEPKRALHTLHAVGGRGHEHPRFMPDGERLLVVRSVPTGDGTERPDLFLWRFRDDELTRATHGAGVREADPTPDGHDAVGVRCANGICDVVRVPLDGGELRVLWAGAPERTFHRPRVSPDGSTALVAVHEDGRWRLAVVPLDGGRRATCRRRTTRAATAADCLSAPDIVATSERGGIAHLNGCHSPRRRAPAHAHDRRPPARRCRARRDRLVPRAAPRAATTCAAAPRLARTAGAGGIVARWPLVAPPAAVRADTLAGRGACPRTRP